MKKYWPHFFLLAFVEVVLALVWLAAIPTDPKNAIFFGFSLNRLAMMGALIATSAVLALAGLLSYHNHGWQDKWLNPDRRPNLYRWGTIISAVTTPLAGLALLFLRYYNPEELSLYFLRARPLLVCFLILSAQFTIWLFLLRFENTSRAFWKRVAFWLLACSAACLLVFGVLSPASQAKIHTWWYIWTFEPSRYERQGADYCAPRYAADEEEKYESARQIRQQLANIDRIEALQGIFSELTAGAKTNTEKHLKILAFIQKSSYHTSAPSSYSEGDFIYDPLVLLEVGDMYCTQGAILAIDLFGAMDYPTRMVQLGHHQIAEIYYDGSWHYFDTDLFGNGEIVLDDDGNIPSVAELSRGEYQKLDALASYQEFTVSDCTAPRNTGYIYPSYYYFSENAYRNAAPFAYMISASEDYTFLGGWEYEETKPEEELLFTNSQPQSTPDKPSFSLIEVDEEEHILKLSFESQDSDNDLGGYRIFVSSHTRGWDYSYFYGESALTDYWANPGGWEPEMYSRLFELPSSDITLLKIETDQLPINIPLASGKTYFISVMPFDNYGENIGRAIYPASNEIRITMP